MMPKAPEKPDKDIPPPKEATGKPPDIATERVNAG
jgi:hypothetical protein